MRAYIKIFYGKDVLFDLDVVKLVSEFNDTDQMLKFVLFLDHNIIDKILVKFNGNLIQLDYPNGMPVISYILDLFDFELEFIDFI